MAMPMRNKLAIFDLDGTLFDTREVNYHAYREALLPFSITLDHDYFITKCNGRHYTEFIPKIMGTADALEEVHANKKATYAKNLDKAKENVHLFQFIHAIKAEYYIAIVTTASKKNLQDILEYFDYLELFDLLITQEDVMQVKPDPEGFLKAMDYFGVSAEHTVIFEDSEVGIQAARASGATVFVVNKF